MTERRDGWADGGRDRQMAGGREGSTERWMEGRRDELTEGGADGDLMELVALADTWDLG